MIAVLIASTVPSSALWIVSGLTVAALGIGPVCGWLVSAPAPKRIIVATLVGFALAALLVIGNTHGGFHGSQMYSCDFSWDMEVLCWLFGLG